MNSSIEGDGDAEEANGFWEPLVRHIRFSKIPAMAICVEYLFPYKFGLGCITSGRLCMLLTMKD